MLDDCINALERPFVVRDLRIYSMPLHGKVSHYRDGDGSEVDAVVHLDDGRWAAYEVRKSHADVDEGATKLHRLANKFDADVEGKPPSLQWWCPTAAHTAVSTECS